MAAREAATSSGPLFRQVLTESRWGDHVHPIAFGEPVCITGVTVGAVPGSALSATPSSLALFARDLETPSTGRFASLCEGFEQPEAGTRAVHVEVSRACLAAASAHHN